MGRSYVKPACPNGYSLFRWLIVARQAIRADALLKFQQCPLLPMTQCAD
jgi:hypothetical protein